MAPESRATHPRSGVLSREMEGGGWRVEVGRLFLEACRSWKPANLAAVSMDVVRLEYFHHEVLAGHCSMGMRCSNFRYSPQSR